MTDQTVPEGQTQEASGSETKEDLIPYSTYKKALTEKKNVQAKIAEYEEKLKQFQQKDLEQTGKERELIDSLRKQNEELSGKLNKTQQNFAWNTLTNTIKSKAIAQGLKPEKADKLIRFLDDDDLNSIEVDGSFNVNEQDLGRVLEKVKSEVPEFFTAGHKMADRVPSQPNVTAKSIKDMSNEEIKEAIARLGKQ
jgi:hypothetical protein